MGKFLGIVFIVAIVALGVLMLGYFAFLNLEATSVTVPFSETYEVSKIGLILVSSALGALAVLIIFVVRDTARFMYSYQYQRRQKRVEKIASLYAKAVNAILADNEAEARDALMSVIKQEPQHTDALLRFGNLDELENKNDSAIEHYNRALASSRNNVEALFSLEEVMRKKSRWREALGYVEKILDIDPDNLAALYRKRFLLERENKWDEIINLQKTIVKFETDTQKKQVESDNMLGFRYELGRDSLEKGEYERADSIFRSILRDSQEKFVPAHLGVAETMLQQNDGEGSVQYLEEAYSKTGSQIILARLEDLVISIGEPSRLIRTYIKAIGTTPQSEQLRFFLGKLYFRLEMVEDAFETLNSQDIADLFPEVHKLLGELYMRRDQCAKAVEHFKKTMELGKVYRVPYCCSVCSFSAQDWSGRCPSCGNWNTFRFNLNESCKRA